MPIGTILPYVGNLSDIPNGWHLCDGTDGTPNLLDNRFLEGSATIGTFKNPGLPNIKGEFNAGHPYPYPTTGPFYVIARGLTFGEGLHGASYYHGFDASHANPIYGASSTVQPASYTVYYIIKLK